MLGHQDDDEETIEFYKIRLMERDREVAAFQAQTKKTQFKHNRDLKEARQAEDRAKLLLREQKSKSDKLTKQVSHSNQQCQVMEKLLAEVKQQKGREVSELTSKYNTLKQQVRSYERILPTFTFLRDLGKTINELPAYEDVFLNLRDSSRHCSQLAQERAQLRSKIEEMERTHRQSQELLRSKKSEAERQTRQSLQRLMECEHQLGDLKLSLSHKMDTVEELMCQLQTQRERVERFQQEKEGLQGELWKQEELFGQALAQREQQLREQAENELTQFEEEVRALEARNQVKENMYQNQIATMEEEASYLQAQLQREKETFQESYVSLKTEIDNTTSHFQELQVENNTLLRNCKHLQNQLKQSQANSSKISAQKTQLEQELLNTKGRITEAGRRAEEKLRVQNQELNRSRKELEDQVSTLGHSCRRLEAEMEALEHENQMLREEVASSPTSKQPNYSLLNLDFRSSTDHSPRSSTDAAKQQTMELENQVEGLNKDKTELRIKLRQIEDENSKMIEEMANLKQERERSIKDTIQMKAKIATLSRNLSNAERSLSSQNVQQSIGKSKMMSLQEQLAIIKEEHSRDKNLVRNLKQEIRQFKETNASQQQTISRQTRNIQGLNSQVEKLSGEKDRIKGEVQVRERGMSQELSLMKSNLQHQDELRKQLRISQQNVLSLEQELRLVKVQEREKVRQIRTMQAQMVSLNQQLSSNQQKISNLTESLERQRKERSLRAVASLASVKNSQDDQRLDVLIQNIPPREERIDELERELSDLKQELQTTRMSHSIKLESLSSENEYYVQTIIDMKVRCAESQMKASEKEHLYTQLKKKAASLNIVIQ